MSDTIIAFASDHAGFQLKNRLMEEAKSLGFDPLDLGCYSQDSVDYPDYGYAMGEAIAQGKTKRGIIVCGTGIGISISANRNPKVRAALCYNETAARLARQHNDANVLALGARLVGEEVARQTLKVFLDTPFEGGRHERRVGKLNIGG